MCEHVCKCVFVQCYCKSSVASKKELLRTVESRALAVRMRKRRVSFVLREWHLFQAVCLPRRVNGNRLFSVPFQAAYLRLSSSNKHKLFLTGQRFDRIMNAFLEIKVHTYTM